MSNWSQSSLPIFNLLTRHSANEIQCDIPMHTFLTSTLAACTNLFAFCRDFLPCETFLPHEISNMPIRPPTVFRANVFPRPRHATLWGVERSVRRLPDAERGFALNSSTLEQFVSSAGCKKRNRISRTRFSSKWIHHSAGERSKGQKNKEKVKCTYETAMFSIFIEWNQSVLTGITMYLLQNCCEWNYQWCVLGVRKKAEYLHWWALILTPIIPHPSLIVAS